MTCDHKFFVQDGDMGPELGTAEDLAIDIRYLRKINLGALPSMQQLTDVSGLFRFCPDCGIQLDAIALRAIEAVGEEF